jgi:hypothetical protein
MVDNATHRGDDVAWCCILSGDYHARLAVLLQSLRDRLPHATCTVFVLGPTAQPSARLRGLAQFVDLTPSVRLGFEPGTAGAPSWANIAMHAKPVVLARMLEAGHRHVVYADADLWMLAPPSSLLRAVREASIVLTPHVVLPPQSRRALANDLVVANAGTFNAGVVAVSDGVVARGFCAWWAERALTFADRIDGQPWDQRWLNLVPYLFRDVVALDDPGVNVGHWRIESDADVACTQDGASLRGHPVSLLHMSGFDPARPSQLSRHAADLALRAGTSLRELAERYAACLAAAQGWVVA